jgi:putative PIN family toxin of toxin-antitoxin system
VRVVLDNNILVSALLSPLGAPAQILAAYRAGRFGLVTSEAVLDELAEVLGRAKFRDRGITPTQAAALLDILRRGAERVEIAGTLQVCRDPKDDKFVETALIGQVDVLVTGDKHLHEAPVVAQLTAAEIEVVRPADFVRALQFLQPIQSGDLFTDWDIKP